MKFHIETYGCKLNQSETEIIRGILSKDFQEASINDADFIILNTCGVVDKTERKIIKRTEELQKKGKKVFWAGCLPKISNCNIADGTLSFTGKETLLCQKRRKDKVSALIAISEGCLGNCSYCISRKARGKLSSYSKKVILQEVNDVLSAGYKEILLTSQGLATYGLDKGKQELVSLLKSILKIDKDFRMRLGMMNPRFTVKIIDQLMDIYKDQRVYKFLHIPIQSGDDYLLKEMNRGYSMKEVDYIISRFNKLRGDKVLATDLIVGHPKETEESFLKTVDFVKKYKPDIVHIFKFSQRKGSLDEGLKDYPDRIKKERSRIITQIAQENNLQKHKGMVGKKYRCLFVKNDIGRTDSGRAVLVRGAKKGEIKNILITDYRWNYLIGCFSR